MGADLGQSDALWLRAQELEEILNAEPPLALPEEP